MDSSKKSQLEKVLEHPAMPTREELNTLFPSCSALGECLGKLHDEQREIEREEVERLVRLREIADRD